MLFPNFCIFIGSMLFMVTLPFVGEALYGNVVYRVSAGGKATALAPADPLHQGFRGALGGSVS